MATITPTTPVVSLTASTHFPIKLTNSNFPVWKCQVHSALVGLGLDAYVDGSLSAPDQYMDTTKTQINPCYTIWYRQDKTIVSALLGSCTDTIQPLLSSAATSRQAWEKLALTYASTSRGRIISLKTTLARTTKGNRSVTEYLAEMYALSEALALAQCPQSEEDLVISILNGLGPDYSEIISAIRVRETPLPLTQLQDILLEQETKQRDVANATASLIPTVNATHAVDRAGDRRPFPSGDRRSSSTRRGRGGYSGAHTRSHSNMITCRFCDNVGHDVKACRKLQRFLRDHQVPYSSTPMVNNTSVHSPGPTGQPWLFDSGASHHVASDASILPSYTDYGGPEEVRLGDGSSHGGANNAGRESS
ncbi:unnamed protein product [Cuscuta epithymum]|uniref:Retrotransposon Copia-like N-terminal domain-containing protein n=1 Tax=Cuscuta epithymum TaxID=186058 RepID=A0AAV0DZM4_9ASTE|nr:unnamed protein product [Cuscuta epithymum]